MNKFEIGELEEQIYLETEEYYRIEESISDFDAISKVKIEDLETRSKVLWAQAKVKPCENYQEIITDFLIAQGGITALKDNKKVMLEILSNKAEEVNKMTNQLEEEKSNE